MSLKVLSLHYLVNFNTKDYANKKSRNISEVFCVTLLKIQVLQCVTLSLGEEFQHFEETTMPQNGGGGFLPSDPVSLLTQLVSSASLL